MAPHGALHIKQKKSAKKRRFRQISAAGANCATAVTRRRAADHRVITHAPHPKPPAADRYAARFCGRRSFSPHPRSGEQRAAFAPSCDDRALLRACKTGTTSGVTRGGAGARHARLDRTLSAQPPGMGT